MRDESLPCALPWIPFSNTKCIQIIRSDQLDHNEGQNECSKLNGSLISLANDDFHLLSQKLLHILQKTDNLSSGYFLTSAVREGSKWVWSNDRIVLSENQIYSPLKAGRCAAFDFQNSYNSTTTNWTLNAIDCAAKEYAAICEMNFAKNCIMSNGQYEGNIDVTKSGLPCAQWSDSSIIRLGYFTPMQKYWQHNYCRNLLPLTTDSHSISSVVQKPWCMINVTAFQECDIPHCGLSEPNKTTEKICDKNYIRCGNSSQCVHSKFICDYDIDCLNGYDEFMCENFMQDFKLIGELKLVEMVEEIWTHVPQIQGCAKRCLRAKNFRCESFSFEPRKELCMLSRVANNPVVLVERLNSFYYQRKFSNHKMHISRDSFNYEIFAEKNNLKTKICVNALSTPQEICKQFNFGMPIIPSTAHANSTPYWTVDCLRDKTCNEPNTKDYQCNNFLRCSKCDETLGEFACQSTGACIKMNQVCDGIVDCEDTTDEQECNEITWRLKNDLLSKAMIIPEGRVQIKFHNAWYDVCSNNIQQTQLDYICSNLYKSKTTGRILPISEETPTTVTWHINYTNHNSSQILGAALCNDRILNIRCEDVNQNVCGQSFFNMENHSRRMRRVVGGTTAKLGAFPWTAALHFRDANEKHHCGASIIAERFLITATHCFQKYKNPNQFYVIVGDFNNQVEEGFEQIFDIKTIHYYPMFEGIFQHDIAIIEIELKNGHGIQYSKAVQPICLPPRGYRYHETQVCIVSGWGNTEVPGEDSFFEYPHKMQYATLPILNKEECRKASELYAAISDTSFCAGFLTGGMDSCHGDSGGPFACEHNGYFYLAGVISWGDGCAKENHPGIYTMVTPYLSWIENITNIIF